MRTIVALMLAVDAAIFLLTLYDVVLARRAPGAARGSWARFTLPLLIVGVTSFQIGDRHAGSTGADLLLYFGPLLLGMALMSILVRLGDDRRARAARPYEGSNG